MGLFHVRLLGEGIVIRVGEGEPLLRVPQDLDVACRQFRRALHLLIVIDILLHPLADGHLRGRGDRGQDRGPLVHDTVQRDHLVISNGVSGGGLVCFLLTAAQSQNQHRSQQSGNETFFHAVSFLTLSCFG